MTTTPELSEDMKQTINTLVLAQLRRLVVNMAETELLEYRRLLRKQLGLVDSERVN